MKYLIFFIALLLGAVNLQAQDLVAEISTQIVNPWKAAYESGDIAALTSTYAKEVVYVNDDGSTTTRTRAEVEARWEKFFETFSGTIEFTNEMVATRLSDDKVSVTGSFTQTRTNTETGEIESYNGSFEHHAVQENGQWKLCRLKVTTK